MDEKVKLFLDELTELSKKYGLYIDGCGCCNAPYIVNENGEIVKENIFWSVDECYK